MRKVIFQNITNNPFKIINQDQIVSVIKYISKSTSHPFIIPRKNVYAQSLSGTISISPSQTPLSQLQQAKKRNHPSLIHLTPSRTHSPLIPLINRLHPLHPRPLPLQILPPNRLHRHQLPHKPILLQPQLLLHNPLIPLPILL